MYYLKEIFIDLDIQNFGFLTQKIVFFAIATLLLLWLTCISIVKLTKFRSKDTRENKIRFGLLISMPIFIILFSIFFFFVVKYNGLHVFDWLDWHLYYNILPHLLTYFSVIITFFVYRYRYFNNIKN